MMLLKNYLVRYPTKICSWWPPSSKKLWRKRRALVPQLSSLLASFAGSILWRLQWDIIWSHVVRNGPHGAQEPGYWCTQDGLHSKLVLSACSISLWNGPCGDVLWETLQHRSAGVQPTRRGSAQRKVSECKGDGGCCKKLESPFFFVLCCVFFFIGRGKLSASSHNGNGGVRKSLMILSIWHQNHRYLMRVRVCWFINVSLSLFKMETITLLECISTLLGCSERLQCRKLPLQPLSWIHGSLPAISSQTGRRWVREDCRKIRDELHWDGSGVLPQPMVCDKLNYRSDDDGAAWGEHRSIWKRNQWGVSGGKDRNLKLGSLCVCYIAIWIIPVFFLFLPPFDKVIPLREFSTLAGCVNKFTYPDLNSGL